MEEENKSLDTELAVIGAIFENSNNEKLLNEIFSRLETAYFQDMECAKAFKVLKNMHERSETIDDILPVERGIEKQFIYYAKGKYNGADKKNIAYYIRCMQYRYLRYSIDGDLLSNADEEIPKLIDKWGIINQGFNEGKQKTCKSLLEINVDLFNTDEKQVTKIKTGFWGIDNLIGGLKPGDIFVIGARPGKGKSTLAINIASRISSGSNGIKSRVLYFSLEMTNKEIASKILSSYTKINGRKIINNTLDDTETETVCNAYSVTSKYDLYIDDKAGVTLSYIRNKINTVKPNVVVIDHIGLIKSENQRFSKYEQLNEISNSLKCIAKDTKTAIIELCQLNREIEGRKNKIPLMRDLRDSGSIEQDADNILLIESDDSETELYRCPIFHLLKVRHGRTGKVQMRFLPEFSLFKDTEQ